MIYTKEQACEEIIRAGHRLVQEGLVSRTWGNISARISETAFLVTPSGRAYETLAKEQLVEVDMERGKFTGTEKPSSEWGIHAECYRLHPDVGFVIHTHQPMASVAGLDPGEMEMQERYEGKIPEEELLLVGDVIQVAAYALPSTKKLTANVRVALEEHPENRAVLMQHHGALVMGKDAEEAFRFARYLEEGGKADFDMAVHRRLEEYYQDAEEKKQKDQDSFPREEIEELMDQIKKRCRVFAVKLSQSPFVYLHSRAGGQLDPWLDDLAQIAGTKILCFELQEKDQIIRELRRKNAVFVKKIGAICTGKTEDDAQAVSEILEKGCLAAFYGENYHRHSEDLYPLDPKDAALQRFVYRWKYSKRK